MDAFAETASLDPVVSPVRKVLCAAQPGSIILMHDGGGNRGETLAAMPSIIDTLRARGYGFDTVSELLGQRTIYSPYG